MSIKDKTLHELGYEKHAGHLLKRLIVLIIIVLIVLWFVRRELVLDLWDWILNLVGK